MPIGTSQSAFDIGRYRSAVFDLDGTVWLSDTPIAGAVEFVDRCRDAGLTITFATNATAISVADITDRLHACALGRPGDVVITGGSVVARTLAANGTTHVLAEAPPAMMAALAELGIAVEASTGTEIPDGWAAPADGRALVLGASRGATFGAVELVGRLASFGHPLYVTSPDPGFPALGHMEPGGGMLLAALQSLYEVEPIVLGKPAKEYADVVRASVRSDGPVVMFGDSQRADMGIANHLGADGVLIGPAGAVRGDWTRPTYVTPGLFAPIEPFEERP